MRVLLKTVANTNALVNTTNKKLCYSCAYAEAKCKIPKREEKIEDAATRGTEKQNETPNTTKGRDGRVS